MNKESLIFTIDYGTQSVRAGIFDKQGNTVVLKKARYEQPYFSNKPGFAEQNPEFYYETLCKITKQIAKENPALLKKCVGISLTCFRDSPTYLDKDNKPVRPTTLWLDERRAECNDKLPLLSRAAFKITGNTETIDLNRKRTPANWIKENEPEQWKRIDKYMNVSTYVIMRLCGRYADSPANYSGHYPIDFKKREFYKKDTHLKGQIFGIPRAKLPTLVPVGEVIGEITDIAHKESGLPVGMKIFAIGSDKSCETLGLGVMDSKTAAVSYGTASTIELTRSKYSDAEPFLPCYPSVVPGYYNMEVQVYRGYWMLSWFCDQFGANEEEIARELNESTLDVLNREMLAIEPGSNGLVLQPYWGAQLRRPLARGAIIGFSDTHSRVHFYRAIIEGIAYALKDGMEFFQKKRTHEKVTSIMISGGGSQCDAICQITADIFGLPVSRVQTNETSSLGAAIAGFLAAKEFASPNEAIKAMVHKRDNFIPNEENHKKYEYLYNKVYLKMFPKLNPLYKLIKSYNKKCENNDF